MQGLVKIILCLIISIGLVITVASCTDLGGDQLETKENDAAVDSVGEAVTNNGVSDNATGQTNSGIGVENRGDDTDARFGEIHTPGISAR